MEGRRVTEDDRARRPEAVGRRQAHGAARDPTAPKSSARQRILDTAYELFSHRGIRAVGVDEVIEKAGVAKATLYRYFPSKDDLVLAFLDLREERWMFGWLEAEAFRRADNPSDQLLSIFDAFDEWFRGDDFEGSVFISVLSELGPDHPVGRASIKHLENLRAFVRELGESARLNNLEDFAGSWIILMKGSIVAAAGGDLEAAKRAKRMATLLIEQHDA